MIDLEAGRRDTQTLHHIHNELIGARKSYSDFHSAHEGLAVIHEEFIELRTEVYRQLADRDRHKMRNEAIQIAAMAIRFITDLRLED